MIKALPAKVAAGSRMELKMRLTKGDKATLRARVFYKYDNGGEQQQIMQRAEDGTYSVSLDARGNNMSVWVKADDDETEPVQVAVVQRLAINRVEGIITPPPYSKLPTSPCALGSSPLKPSAVTPPTRHFLPSTTRHTRLCSFCKCSRTTT